MGQFLVLFNVLLTEGRSPYIKSLCLSQCYGNSINYSLLLGYINQNVVGEACYDRDRSKRKQEKGPFKQVFDHTEQISYDTSEHFCIAE